MASRIYKYADMFAMTNDANFSKTIICSLNMVEHSYLIIDDGIIIFQGILRQIYPENSDIENIVSENELPAGQKPA